MSNRQFLTRLGVLALIFVAFSVVGCVPTDDVPPLPLEVKSGTDETSCEVYFYAEVTGPKTVGQVTFQLRKKTGEGDVSIPLATVTPQVDRHVEGRELVLNKSLSQEEKAVFFPGARYVLVGNEVWWTHGGYPNWVYWGEWDPYYFAYVNGPDVNLIFLTIVFLGLDFIEDGEIDGFGIPERIGIPRDNDGDDDPDGGSGGNAFVPPSVLFEITDANLRDYFIRVITAEYDDFDTPSETLAGNPFGCELSEPEPLILERVSFRDGRTTYFEGDTIGVEVEFSGQQPDELVTVDVVYPPDSARYTVDVDANGNTSGGQGDSDVSVSGFGPGFIEFERANAVPTNTASVRVSISSDLAPSVQTRSLSLGVRRDQDGDNVPDSVDVCPDVSDPTQLDNDNDGVGNVCDICPALYNPGQEPDADCDGITDDRENPGCENDPDPECGEDPVDITPPEVTLNGPNPYRIRVGNGYTDFGATVRDNVDATRTVDGTGLVDTLTPGNYTVTYTASDSSGNVAVPVTRTVIVFDDIAPTISLIGSPTITVNEGSTFNDPGAQVTDNVDVGLVATSNAGTAVDTSRVGTYTVTYTASDSSGNVAVPVTRTVQVVPVIIVDNEAPVISVEGPNPYEIEAGDDYTEFGAMVTDNVDMGLVATSNAGTAVDTSRVGNYTVTYTASDSSGNVAVPVTRTVQVVDTTDPVIELLGDDPLVVDEDTEFEDPGATATDNASGDVSINSASTVVIETPGTYTIIYTATDGSGNEATKTRTVEVLDVTAPTISLIGSPTITINEGSAFNDPGARVTDNVDATRTVNSSDSVDTSNTGTYTITYTASDSSGNVAVPVTRTVQVVPVIIVDNEAPVIELDGPDPIVITAGDSFVDPLGTATDNIDGEVPLTSNADTAVDTMNPGTYTIIYRATDNAGNTETAVRDVVVEPAPLVVTVTTPYDADRIFSENDSIEIHANISGGVPGYRVIATFTNATRSEQFITRVDLGVDDDGVPTPESKFIVNLNPTLNNGTPVFQDVRVAVLDNDGSGTPVVGRLPIMVLAADE